MKIYRTGSHWGVTIVQSDMDENPDQDGRRPSDKLIATAQDSVYAELIVLALNGCEVHE